MFVEDTLQSPVDSLLNTYTFVNAQQTGMPAILTQGKDIDNSKGHGSR